ncbi:hypothetical protein MKY96_30225 [Paenibacillus sp. FSL R7-0302]|uniref:hypothetical protein n=1 Tax=Paenibacillus sp. FSL R7-0302 TaxID=2921681 RepID=UPI0030F4DD73
MLFIFTLKGSVDLVRKKTGVRPSRHSTRVWKRLLNQGAKHLSLTDLPLFSPILANMLQRGQADIDKYYCIETMNRLILEFYDYTLKGTGRFAPQVVY